jgi:pantetheine-phosphate adenylyltransferase
LTTAFYPGVFDPITNGHLDIAVRAAKLFERVVVGVYDLPDKTILFSTEERVDLVKKAIAGTDFTNIEVTAFNGLTVDYARKIGAQTIVRGLRVATDFEREFDMAMMNKRIAPDCELVCMMASQQYQFVSSSRLKEVVSLDGPVNDFLPKVVEVALRAKMKGT